MKIEARMSRELLFICLLFHLNAMIVIAVA